MKRQWPVSKQRDNDTPLQKNDYISSTDLESAHPECSQRTSSQVEQSVVTVPRYQRLDLVPRQIKYECSGSCSCLCIASVCFTKCVKLAPYQSDLLIAYNTIRTQVHAKFLRDFLRGNNEAPNFKTSQETQHRCLVRMGAGVR